MASVHFIKMDMEGAESKAIRGMTELLKRFHPTLLIETHGEVAREGLKFLCSVGYQLERLDGQGNVKIGDMNISSIGNEHWLALPGENKI
ncbi:MAG: FkbM family methyltransferase [Aggregatilineales bacterium]